MFGIPPTPREVFSRNFLRSATIVASYKETTTCTTLRDQFKNMFAEDLPDVVEVDPTRFNIKDGIVTQDETYKAKQVTLRSLDLSNRMTLTDNSCKYEVSGKGYVSSDDFIKQFNKVAIFLQNCGVKKINKLSLQKLNILQFKAESEGGNPIPIYGPLFQVLSNDLNVNYDKLDSIPLHINQSMQTLQLEENGYMLTVKYGFQVQDKAPDLTSATGLVILDLSMSRNNVVVDAVGEELNVFNSELYNAFRWAITDNTLKLLRNE